MKELLLIIGVELDGKDENGFTLLETLISLLILTLIGGTFLSFYAINNFREAKVENDNKFYFAAFSLGQELLHHLYEEREDGLIYLLSDPKTIEDLNELGYDFSTPHFDDVSGWEIAANNLTDGVFKFFKLSIKNQNGDKIIFNYAEPGRLFYWGGGLF